MSISDRLNYARMKSKHQKMLLPWHKKWWGVLLIIFLIILVIIVIFSTFYVINRTKEIIKEREAVGLTTNTLVYLKSIEGDGSNYYLGKNQSFYNYFLNAQNNINQEPVVDVVVFSNFSCAFSAQSSRIMRSMATEFGEKVRFVFRDSPTQDSIILAVGARCAGEQGKFWEMHDFLFELQDDFSSLIEEDEKKLFLKQMAEILELDTEKFNTCLEERKYLEKIKKDYEDGEKLNISGTPTWFVNGQEIIGSLSEDLFRNLLSGLIK